MARVLFSIFVGCTWIPIASAQRVTGEIVGTVRDSTQAVVAGVTITLTHQDTKAARTATTDNNGFYRAPTLEIGRYTIEAALSGFKTSARRDVELHVNEVLRMDFVLEVGGVTEQVTVEATTPVVSTETGEISTIVDTRQVVNLPLNGRIFIQLGMINPGVNQKAYGTAGGFVANGLPTPYVNVQLDSGEIMDFADQNGQIGVLANFPPSVDSIAEFTLQTSSYSAQYGRQAGANVNVVTKSGTNNFHGSAFEFFRNQSLDARNFFSPDKPRRLLNQYGATVGGPIVRDKMFFFFSFEGTRNRTGIVNTQTVPNAAMRRGDFSELLPRTVVRDPDTGEPFPGNVIPSGRQEPLALQVLEKIYPLPNATGAINFIESPVKALDQDQYLPKIDLQLTPRNRLSTRYIINNLFDVIPWSIGGNNWCRLGYPRCSVTNDTRDQNLVANLTSTISPSTIANTQFMYMRRNEQPIPIGLTATRVVAIPELSPNNRQAKMPAMNISGFAQSHVNTEHPHPRITNIFKWSEHLTRIVGRHTFTFGGDIARIYYDNIADYSTNGTFTFDGSATGYALADFLTGRAFSYLENTEPLVAPNRTWRFEPYVEDRIKVSQRLTVGLGLRYSIYPPTLLANDRNSNWSPRFFDPTKAPQIDRTTGRLIPGTYDPNTYYLNGVYVAGKDSPYGRRIAKTRYTNFGPRLDFAFDPTGHGRWAIRGGVGAFFDAPVGNYYDCCGGTKPPFSLQPTIFNTRLANPGGGTQIPQATAFDPIDEAGEITTVWTWNLGVEHELLPRTKLSASYVGNHGYHEPQRPNINQPGELSADVALGRVNLNAVRPYLGFSSLTQWQFSAGSKYHSLQLLLNRQYSSGLQLRAAYTWSKTTTSGCDSLYCSPMDAYDYRLTRGLAGQDVPHIFVVSYLWQIPGFRGSGGVAGAILGGWTLTGITAFQSGSPLNITISPNRSGNGAGGQRPNINGPITQDRTVDSWFDTTIYSLPEPGTYGILGYNSAGRGPGISNFDFGLHKEFRLKALGEGGLIEFRTEWFNIFNHTQFDAVGTTFATSTFGRVTTARDARIGQMALKIYW
jgi:Carboxypeptidase regulatory-like domain